MVLTLWQFLCLSFYFLTTETLYEIHDVSSNFNDQFTESNFQQKILLIGLHLWFSLRSPSITYLRAKRLSLSRIAHQVILCNYDIIRFHLHFIQASLSSKSKRSDLCRGRRDYARVSPTQPALSSHRRQFSWCSVGIINSLLPSSRVIAELIIAANDVYAPDERIGTNPLLFRGHHQLLGLRLMNNLTASVASLAIKGNGVKAALHPRGRARPGRSRLFVDHSRL